MTVPVEAEDAAEHRPATGGAAPRDTVPRMPVPGGRDAVRVCPYLTASGGSWRMAAPSRDHRCLAVDPPAPQTTDKQRRHCLVSDHAGCSMFRAARDARATMLAAGADPGLVADADRRRRPLARTSPILLERPRLVDQAVHLQFERGPGQIALIALMIVAFAVVALARLSSGEAASSPSPAASQLIAIATPSATFSPVPSASIAASATASTIPTATPRTTYKVKKGDTLLTIAKRFSTTAAKIRAFNGLTSATLKTGQVLKIP